MPELRISKLYTEGLDNGEYTGKAKSFVREKMDSANWFIDFLENKNHWKSGYNHNQLRITRIIKSLLLLVSREEAESFHQQVISLINPNSSIPAKAHDYWNHALDNEPASRAS